MGDDEITPPEKKVYDEDEVKEIVRQAQERQLQADEMRTYGNMFFAEALDHISTLAKGDRAWKIVYEYGNLFRKQFEANTGQSAPQFKTPEEKESPAPKKEDRPS